MARIRLLTRIRRVGCDLRPFLVGIGSLVFCFFETRLILALC